MDRKPLPIVLIASVIQGWALYGLYYAIEHHQWPATRMDWLLALYAIATFIPTTVQLIAGEIWKRFAVVLLLGMTVLLFYFGWFEGTDILSGKTFEQLDRGFDSLFPMAFELLLLWLIAMPFVQGRLTTGRWVPEYPHFFALAWRNKVVLAEAALFTGLLWLLLLLWQQLFHLLGIDFFRELFERAIFAYPVTALAFGFGIFLVGSLDHWVRVVLDQVLNLLKWLGVIAAGLLTLFTLTLLFKLGVLFASGKHVVDAAWLLWLVAAVVLFVNAAFRDGSATDPYPRVLGIALRYVVPLLIVVAATAAYALIVRTQRYGLTVERFWALVVAGFALLYAAGYSYAAMRPGAWMSRIAPVNVGAALMMMAVLCSTLSPLLSPYRLSANSQYDRALHWQNVEPEPRWPNQTTTPFLYLRFHGGAYGMRKLRQLADSGNAWAAAAIAQKSEWQPPLPIVPDIQGQLASLAVFPSGRTIAPELRDVLVDDLTSQKQGAYPFPQDAWTAGLFVDLNGDYTDEFVLLRLGSARVYRRDSSGWKYLASMGMLPPPGLMAKRSLIDELTAKDIAVLPQHWSSLRIGKQVFRFSDDPDQASDNDAGH